MQLWHKQKDSSFIQYKTFKMQLSWIVVSKYCTSAIWEHLNIGFKVRIKANLHLLTYFLTTFSANSSSTGYLSVLFLQDSGIPWRPVWKHIKVTTESITGTFTISNHCQASAPKGNVMQNNIFFTCCCWPVCVCGCVYAPLSATWVSISAHTCYPSTPALHRFYSHWLHALCSVSTACWPAHHFFCLLPCFFRTPSHALGSVFLPAPLLAQSGIQPPRSPLNPPSISHHYNSFPLNIVFPSTIHKIPVIHSFQWLMMLLLTSIHN